jgi:hypothetical protein
MCLSRVRRDGRCPGHAVAGGTGAGKAGQRLELAAEGAVVGIAAVQCDIGDGHVTVQQAVGVFQPGLVNHLARGQVKHFLAVAFQLGGETPAMAVSSSMLMERLKCCG